MSKHKILLDTDIGTDMDDAVCLVYLLSHPDCDLLGITTVTGEATKRAMLASAICKHVSRDIPIYPGAENPLVVLKQQLAQQAACLPRWKHKASFPAGEAVEFMRKTIRKYPGEVTLLTIAPLTNIGLLFSVDPEIPRLLRGLVMMCGRFFEPIPDGYGPLEWNAIGDPHATAIVYRSGVRIHRSVGLDVTAKVYMPADEFRRTFRNVKVMEPVLDFAEIWFKDWPGSTFHDPLAAATIFEPGLVTFQKGMVDVDLKDSASQGLTRWTATDSGPHEIGSEVDKENYFIHFMTVIGGKNRT